VIGISAAALFGLVLIIASLSLFLTSKFKPDLYQESDNIYAVIGIVCGILLVASYDLGAAMAFQQMLMIGSLITIMWQFMQVRAENKRLKGGGRSTDREAPLRRGYNAQLDDEPEYAPAKRRNRRNEDNRFDRSNNERDSREELPSRRSATRELPESQFAESSPRRRFAETAPTEARSLTRRQNDSWDSDEDWNEQEPVTVRRALPDADLASQQTERRPVRKRSQRPELEDFNRDRGNDIDPAPRRRRPRPDSPGDDDQRVAASASASRQRRDTNNEGTTANYVDYEPIDPPSGLPPSGSEPIVFPDRY
jgi:Ycf66 protein N-terminus